jgi:signal transduction histidine kinase
VPEAAATGHNRGRSSLRPLRVQLALALALVGGALALCLAVIVASLARLTDSRLALIGGIDPAGLAARDLRAAVVDQETGIRGYALTGQRSYLEPYERGQADDHDIAGRLRGLLGDRPDLVADVDGIERAVEQWQRETAGPTVAAVGRGDPALISTPAFQEAGKTRFDQVRAALDRLDADIAAERQARADALHDAAGRVAAAVAALAAVMVVAGTVLVGALRRSVTGPVQRLSEEVRLVAAGDLDRRVHGSGAAEFAGLAADIDAMRVRIVDELARLRQATAAVERQAQELSRSNADLEQFAYVASHDLQEPLRKVAGFCQLLERRYKGQLDERADEYIHYAVDGAQRMQQLINDLLAFSRVGRTSERFEPVPLVDAVHRALDNLTVAVRSAGATIEIGALPTVTGDPRLLTALFQNLIANGIKFHRPGVAPRVEVRARTPSDGSAVTVSVSDNGIGIEDRYAEQIFTLFKRLHTKSDYEGTGIGLALCKRIVEFHGGRIWLEPTQGVGATFHLTLPFDQPDLPDLSDPSVLSDHTDKEADRGRP